MSMEGYKEVRHGVWKRGRNVLLEKDGVFGNMKFWAEEYGNSRQTLGYWITTEGIDARSLFLRLEEGKARKKLRETGSLPDSEFSKILTAGNTWREPSTGCVLWTGMITSRGYGRVMSRDFSGRLVQYNARIISLLAAGKLEKYEKQTYASALPDCPRNCVNPEHLTLYKSMSEFAKDQRKARPMRGFDSNSSKLTPEALEFVQDCIGEGSSNRQIIDGLKDGFHITYSLGAVNAIRKGVSWKGVGRKLGSPRK